MKKHWLILSALVALTASAEEPDLNFEAKLHDIYVNFHNEKLGETQWRDLVGGRANEAYRIQNGDTLWGVSQVFFGDGNYWPKIWSVNSEIVNPHLISTGNTIRFILGDESDAPSFAITENTDGMEEKEAPAVSARKMTRAEEDDDIPAPTQEFKPVLRHIPSSLPDWQASRSSRYSVQGISLERLHRKPIVDRSYLQSYIGQTYPESFGHIVEVENAGISAGQNQYIYVEGEGGALHTGDRFTVVKSLGKLVADGLAVERRGLESVVEIQGQIVIQDKVESVKQDGSKEIFRAFVEKALTPLVVGSDLSKETLQVYEFGVTGPRSEVVAQIIGGAGSQNMNFYGERAVVYLNRGSADGVNVGHILPIRSNISLRKENTLVAETVAPIGYLKILNVQPQFSTAVIVRSFDDIRTGDLTGHGPLNPANAKVSANRTSNSAL